MNKEKANNHHLSGKNNCKLYKEIITSFKKP